MSTTIQIHNVPDELHHELKARAALLGVSLSEYLLREVRKLAAQPTLEEMLAQLDRPPPVELSVDPVDIIRQERDQR